MLPSPGRVLTLDGAQEVAMIPEWKTPASAFLWILGVFVFGIVVRVGWEFGGKVWTLF